MHTLSWASVVFLASAGAAHAATKEMSGILEVDLVFPRNETYAPSDYLPVIFGFQNPELAPLLTPSLGFNVWDWNNMSNTVTFGIFDLQWTNFSSTNGSTYFEHRLFFHSIPEGNWMLKWTLGWDSCPKTGLSIDRPVSHSSTNAVHFTTKNDAQKMDVAAIGEGCTKDQGFAINITGTHDRYDGETCAAVADSATVSDPCRVKIGAAAASSISASMTDQKCERGYSQIDCPSKENAAPREVVGGVAGLMIVLGALSHFLI